MGFRMRGIAKGAVALSLFVLLAFCGMGSGVSYVTPVKNQTPVSVLRQKDRRAWPHVVKYLGVAAER